MASRNDATPGEITRLLRAWRAGDDGALEDLWPHVYGELRALARGILRRRGRTSTERATSLVHKAYLRLLGSEVDWTDRRHFFLVAARAMRFVLADEARRQLTKKRGEGETLALDDSLPEPVDPAARRPEEVLAVHEALTRLAVLRPRQEQIVELRYFAGLSVEEAAEILEITPRTMARDWRAARTWLHAELRDSA